MKIGQQIKFIVMNKQASSLYSLIADGQRRLTSLGRDTWISLMGSYGYLEPHCNREGFNILSDDTSMGKARIGIIANNENDCATCDYRIGFGTGGRHNDAITCGSQDQTSVGYILVQWNETGDRNRTASDQHKDPCGVRWNIYVPGVLKKEPVNCAVILVLFVRKLFKPIWLDLVFSILLSISIWLWFFYMKLRDVDQKHAKLLKSNWFTG